MPDQRYSPEFKDQCIVVTGAASGIGAALTRELLEQGARVAALDIQAEGLASLRETCQASAAHLRTFTVDVSQSTSVDQALSDAQAALGPFDKLACVAGVLEMGEAIALTDAQWARCFAINATGVFNVCRYVARGMITRHAGAIVNVSSNAAATPRAGMSAYAASKAAVSQFSRCLGLELARHGIRVNLVSPGSTDTAMQQAMWDLGSSKDKVIVGSPDHFRLGIPLAKIATPEEIVQSILFLLSERASHITLHDLRVDGGATLDQG